MNPIRQLIKKSIPAVIPQRLFLAHGAPDEEFRETSHSFNNCRKTIHVSFTFDDGPDPEHTPHLLDILKQYHQRATFFVIGEKAQQYPELIERIITEGHEIGNHTFTHSEPSQTSTRQFLNEIKKTDQLLKQITGQTPDLVRPPKGKLSISKLLGLWLQHRSVVLWDTDPRDYLMTEISEMTEWYQGHQPATGNFYLMHDNHQFAAEAVRQLSENTDFHIQSHIVSHWLKYKSYQTLINQRAHA